jgi:hypothetical protein
LALYQYFSEQLSLRGESVLFYFTFMEVMDDEKNCILW